MKEFSKDEYSIMLGMFGNNFLTHYINEAEPNQIYKQRVKNIFRKKDIHGNNIYTINKNPKDIIQFQKFNKRKLIDVLGINNFIKEFYFPISMDLIHTQSLEYEPEYINILDNNPCEEYIMILGDIMMDYFQQSKKSMEKIYTLWEVLNYHFRNNEYPEYGRIRYFDLKSGKEIEVENIDNMGGHEKIAIFDLMEMGFQLESLFTKLIEDFREILFFTPFYNKFNSVSHGFEFKKEQIINRVLHNTLDNYIYFHNEDTPVNFMEAKCVPLFFKEKSNKFPSRGLFYNYIIKGG